MRLFIVVFVMLLLPIRAFSCISWGPSTALINSEECSDRFHPTESFPIKFKVKILKSVRGSDKIKNLYHALFLAQVLESNTAKYIGEKIIITGFDKNIEQNFCGHIVTKIGSEGYFYGSDYGETYSVKGWLSSERFKMINNNIINLRLCGSREYKK